VVNKALQVPRESRFRVLWYVISSTAFFVTCSLQLEQVSKMSVFINPPKRDLCIYITLTNSWTAALVRDDDDHFFMLTS